MIWDFWAKHYNRLWVQKYSLTPTRDCVKDFIREFSDGCGNFLDMGCATAQLMKEVFEEFSFSTITGVDISSEMINEAKKAFSFPQNNDVSDFSDERNIRFILCSVDDIKTLKLDTFSVITCTHSLPYYKNREKAINDLADMLDKDGILIVACGSVNNFWDNIALSVVKLTTGKADYPSISALMSMVKDKLEVVKVHTIKKRWYMPGIVVLVYRRL